MSAGMPQVLLRDENRGPVITGVLSTAWALAFVNVSLRMYLRFKHHTHGWDDYTIYAAVSSFHVRQL